MPAVWPVDQCTPGSERADARRLRSRRRTWAATAWAAAASAFSSATVAAAAEGFSSAAGMRAASSLHCGLQWMKHACGRRAQN